MGVKVGVYRAERGPLGKSQCQLMVIKHGINSERSIYMVVCIGSCVVLNCSGETEPISTYE